MPMKVVTLRRVLLSASFITLLLGCSLESRQFEPDAGKNSQGAAAGSSNTQSGGQDSGSGGTGASGGQGGELDGPVSNDDDALTSDDDDDDGAVIDANGPVLSVAAQTLDLGGSVVGFTSIRRLAVSNQGKAKMMVPSVTLSPESDADFAIAQNLCITELAPEESCDLRIQLLPSRVGVMSGVLKVDAGAAGTVEVTLQGEGLEAGDLVVTPSEGSSTDFGAVDLGADAEMTFTIANPGDQDSGSLEFSVSNEDFVIESVNCESVAAGGVCEITVRFTPSSPGTSEATLTVTSPDLGSTSVQLNATALSPGRLIATPETQDFRSVVLGVTASATVVISNGGDQAVTIDAVMLSEGSDPVFSIASTDCAAEMVLGGAEGEDSCDVEIAFAPTSATEAMGAVHITTQAGQSLDVDLRGQGLLPGALTLTAEAGSSGDFGDVLLGSDTSKTFVLTNTGDEPSGTIEVSAGNDFTVLPAEPGECVGEETNLGGGESCTVRVRFSPTERGARSASLSAASLLAGGASLALTGRGIVDAKLASDDDQLSFGSVVVGATSEASTTLSNVGDRELPAPTFALGTATSGSAGAFSTSGCDEALPPGDECTLTVTFSPTLAVAHSVPLQVGASPGGTLSVLLVGSGIEPGSLEIAPSSGSSTDFGDVPVATSKQQSYTVTNPGGEPSGLLSITSSSTRFSVQSGTCGTLDAAGLVDGETCSFMVTFSPDTSTTFSTTLSISSPGAGNAGVSLTGRGRTPAHLVGSNSFNYGTVIIGESSDTRNWAVSNDGDLATGPLTVGGSNSEFAIITDGCGGKTLAAGTSCTVSVRFSPNTSGARSATLTTSDGTASSVSLSVSGTGQALPGLGSPCLDGRCASGASCETHPDGVSLVCCGDDCSTSERCSSTFTTCELPTVGPGQGCSPTVLCQSGYVCNAPTNPGRCCPSSCTDACETCNNSGVCSTVSNGQVGGCTNGLVCQSGSCQCPGACAGVPAGWNGPVAATSGTCGGSYSLTSKTLYSGVSGGSQSCSCTCSVGTAPSCNSTVPVYIWDESSTCSGTADLTMNAAVSDGGAMWVYNDIETLVSSQLTSSKRTAFEQTGNDSIDDETIWSNDYFSVGTLGLSGGSCTGSTPTKSFGTPTLSGKLVLCSASGSAGTCPNGDQCMSNPGSGFESKLCVWRTGSQTCPSGYPNRRELYGSYTDGRSCTSCSCGAPTGSCTVSKRLCDRGCDDDVTLGSGCTASENKSFLKVREVSVGIPGLGTYSCGAGSTSVTGSVTGTDTHTVCCQ